MNAQDWYIDYAIEIHKQHQPSGRIVNNWSEIEKLAKKYTYLGGHATCEYNGDDGILPCFMFKTGIKSYLHVLYVRNQNPVMTFEEARDLSDLIGSKNINCNVAEF